MHLVTMLRRLWRRPAFRRLLGIRILGQGADGTMEVGMASYILFSPESQPNAAAIATVLAITMLPFSLLGPFLSVFLDRWSRRQTSVVVDFSRAALGLGIAAIVASGHTDAGMHVVLYVLLLITLSLNRFVLAGLAAAMQHTVDREDYLNASAVMPMIGPTGLLAGGIIAGGIRIIGSQFMPTYRCDAITFTVAAVTWVFSAVLALGFPRDALGPSQADRLAAERRSVGQVWHGLVDAARHLRDQRPAALGLTIIVGQRFLFGLLSVAVVLMYRNLFNANGQVSSALLGTGAWGAAVGAGLVLSAALVPPLSRRLGLRRTAIVLLVLSGVVQLVPGSILRPWALVVSGFFIGWFAQSFKICVDTLTQAHVGEQFKGRVFTIYDGAFNAILVVAALVGWAVLPDTGDSHPVFLMMVAGYLVLALAFWAGARRIGPACFDEGTSLG